MRRGQAVLATEDVTATTVFNGADCRKDEGGAGGGVRSASSADAGADSALEDAPEVDTALESRTRMRHAEGDDASSPAEPSGRSM
jgi:hypothetical protein